MANFRGMDGSVRFNANVVGEIKDWSMNATIEELDDTVMGDSWATVVGGISKWTGSASAQLDYGDTLGQKAIIDKLLIATPASSSTALELRVSATKYFSGSALLSGINISSGLGAIVMVSFNFTGNGALLVGSWS
jgi:hypothetical protein